MRDRWNRLAVGHAGAGRQANCRSAPVHHQARLAVDVNQGDAISRVNQVWIFNLLVGVPDRWPLPRVVEESSRDVPQCIPLDYNVLIRVVVSQRNVLCCCCTAQKGRKDEANEFPFHCPFPINQASSHDDPQAVIGMANEVRQQLS